MKRIAILILGLSLAPLFCWAAQPNADQAKAIAEIQKMGGNVTFFENSPGEPGIGVSLDSRFVILPGLISIHESIPQVWSPSGKVVTDEGLTSHASNTKVTDAGVAGHSVRGD